MLIIAIIAMAVGLISITAVVDAGFQILTEKQAVNKAKEKALEVLKQKFVETVNTTTLELKVVDLPKKNVGRHRAAA